MTLNDSIKKLTEFLSITAELTFGKKTEELCRLILDQAVKQADCLLAECWSVNPRNQTLIRVAEEPSGHATIAANIQRKPMLEIGNCTTGRGVKSKRPTLSDFNDPETRSQFKNQELLDSIGARYLVSVPVLTTGNPHQVLCVLNFFSTIRTLRRQSGLLSRIQFPM